MLKMSFLRNIKKCSKKAKFFIASFFVLGILLGSFSIASFAFGAGEARIFVTSKTFSGEEIGNYTKAYGGNVDQICVDQAKAASLSGEWVAILGRSSVKGPEGYYPSSSLYSFDTYKNMNEEVVFSGTFQRVPTNPIKYDENGNQVSGAVVWTGIESALFIGPVVYNPRTNADNWNFPDGYSTALAGINDSTDDGGWLIGGGARGKAERARVYCMDISNRKSKSAMAVSTSFTPQGKKVNPYDFIKVAFSVAKDGRSCSNVSCDNIKVKISSEKGVIVDDQDVFHSNLAVKDGWPNIYYRLDPYTSALGEGVHQVKLELSSNEFSEKFTQSFSVDIVSKALADESCGNGRLEEWEGCDDGNKDWYVGECDRYCRFKNFMRRENLPPQFGDQEIQAHTAGYLYGNLHALCTQYYGDYGLETGGGSDWTSHGWLDTCASYNGDYPNGSWVYNTACQHGFVSFWCAPATPNEIAENLNCSREPTLYYGVAGVSESGKNTFQYSTAEVLETCFDEYKLYAPEGERYK